MNTLNRQLGLWIGTLLTGVMLSNCASQNFMEVSEMPTSSVDEAPMAEQAATNQLADSPTEPAKVSQAQPQLVKTANLTIRLDSIDAGLDQIRQLVQQDQGDILSLQDQTARNTGRRRIVLLQIRVPQDNLDVMLDALRELGTVQSQSLTAEDVSTQLVDFEARLRNLKRTEETLLEIMKRSGEVGDVLQVAQELSNVRKSIEQITAQLRNLQSRVAYSTINLSLESAIAVPSAEKSFQRQVVETWQASTRSLSQLTTGLFKLGIWLLVYTPYLLPIVALILFIKRRHNRQVTTILTQSDQQSE